MLLSVCVCVCEGNACLVGQPHCPSSSLLITPLPPCGLSCLQTSVLLDWVFAEQNLLSVGEDRFCIRGDFQVKAKAKNVFEMRARLHDSIINPAPIIYQMLHVISHRIIQLNTFCFNFQVFYTTRKLFHWLPTICGGFWKCEVCLPPGLCGDTLDLMLFSPLIFVFPHWQYDNLDNRSFFFFFSLGCVWIVCECTRPAGNTKQQSRPRWPLPWRHHPGYQWWQHRAHDAHGGSEQDQNLHSAAHPHHHQVGNTIYTPLFNARQWIKT